MNLQFKASFTKDLRKIKDKELLRRIKESLELVEQAQNLQEIQHLKKLRGGGSHYRLRVGEYRIGLIVEKDIATFVRCLSRKDIYKYFP